MSYDSVSEGTARCGVQAGSMPRGSGSPPHVRRSPNSPTLPNRGPESLRAPCRIRKGRACDDEALGDDPLLGRCRSHLGKPCAPARDLHAPASHVRPVEGVRLGRPCIPRVRRSLGGGGRLSTTNERRVFLFLSLCLCLSHRAGADLKRAPVEFPHSPRRARAASARMTFHVRGIPCRSEPARRRFPSRAQSSARTSK